MAYGIFRKSVMGLAALFAVAAGVAARNQAALAQVLPAAGHYQCVGGGADAGKMDFIVGPGNIYTTTAGRRGIMVVHPGTGNVLFRGAAPQEDYEGRYGAGPPPQVAFLTVKGRVSTETGIICRLQ